MSKNTVFIIGAGASKEAGMPTGEELKKEIADKLDIRFDTWEDKFENGDYEIVKALRIKVNPPGIRGSIGPYVQEAHQIVSAMPQAISIDNFIDNHRGNEKLALCGKLAIVRSISDAEQRSLLYFERNRVDSNIDFNRLLNTWYPIFFQKLTENCIPKQLEDRFKSITLIIFNYDRCVEHYLCNSLKNYYKIEERAAAKLVNSINIYHPYGSVGRLPWENKDTSVDFGTDIDADKLLQLAQGIKTFTEGTDPGSSEISKIRKHIGIADKLVFLGFAFHSQNLELIDPKIKSNVNPHNVNCFASAYRISEYDQKGIENDLKRIFNQRCSVNLFPGKCYDFFNEFWRSLSF